MAGFFGRLLDRLRGRKKPAPQQRDNTQRMFERERTGTQLGTPLELGPDAPSHYLPGTDLDDFVWGGQLQFVNSSNVAAAQYFYEAKEMMVEFKGGAAYIYSGVPVEVAIEFMRAKSKGSMIWDRFRIRGTKYGHKFPYRRIK